MGEAFADDCRRDGFPSLLKAFDKVELANRA